MQRRSAERGSFREALRSDYWRAETTELVLAAWEASGDSLSGFARRHGVQRERLCRWRDRLRRSRSSGGPAFHPVLVGESPRECAAGSEPAALGLSVGVEVLVGWGRRIVVRRGFDAETLLAVVRVLEVEGC